MSIYLPPILHNNELNPTFNSNDFNYQFENINYVQGDKRYTKKSDYNTKTSLIDSSFNLLENKTTQQSYSAGTTLFSGNVSVSGTLQGLNNSVFGFLNSISSNVQTQLTNLQTITSQQSYSTNTTTFLNNVTVSGTLQGLNNTIYGYLSSISSNVQSQLNSLSSNITSTNASLSTLSGTVASNNTNLQTQISTLQTNTTGISYNSTNDTTDITNNVGIWNNATVYGTLQGLNPIIYSYLNSISSNVQTQLTNLQTITSQQSYSTNTTTFSNNVVVSGNLNNITPTQLSMLNTLETTTGDIQQRFYELENFRNTYLNNHFGFVEVPVPSGYDIYFITGHMRLGDNIEFNTSINGISTTVFNYIANLTSDCQTQLNSINQKLTGISYNSTVDYTDITNNVTITGNLNVSSLNFNISSTILSYLSGLSSNVETSIQNINQKLTGVAYNATNDYTDITNNMSVYGNFGFTGTINTIPRATFMFISNVTSDIQTQLNSIVSSITTTNTNLTTTNSNLTTTNTNLATTNTNISNNYVDKSNTQTITGTKTFSTVNVENLYATNVFSTNVPIYYNSNTTISSSLSNVYVNLTSGCTTITMPSIDINEGQTLILSNLTSNSITVNCPSGSSFIGPLYVDDGTNTFSLPKTGRAVICNNGSFWDIIHLSSNYDWSKPGLILLDAIGSYNATLNIYYSCSNLTNVYNQPDGSSSLTSSDRQDTSLALNGIYKFMSANDNISGCVVFPNYGCVLYSNSSYTGTVLVNYKNRTKNPVCLTLAIFDVCSSLKLYYNDVLIESL